MSGAPNGLTADEEKLLRGEAEPAQTQNPEPALEPAPEPEQAPEPSAEPVQGRDDKGKFTSEKVVPLAAHLEEREKLQRRIEEAKREAAEKMARLEERLSFIQQQYRQPEPKQPSIDEDPVGGIKRTAQTVEQLQQQLQTQAQQQAFANTVGAHVAQFRAQTPDYDAAYQHLIQSRIAELSMINPNPAAVQAQVAHEEQMIAIEALRQNKNPAEVVYGLAKHRGYTGKPAAPAKPDPAAVVDAATKAAAVAAPLAGTRGNVPATKGTIEWLAGLSNDEFKNLSDSDFKRIMGG